MNDDRGNLSVIACDSGKSLAERIMHELQRIAKKEKEYIKHELKETKEITFPDGEIKVELKENVRGDDIYVVQCIYDPCSKNTVNDNIMALLTACHACSQSDADHITAVVPQFPYSRQERRKTREAISAKLIADMLESAGVQRVITLDIHAEAIQGFFNRAKLEDLHASTVIIENFRKMIKFDPAKLVVTGPDVGSAEKARHYSKKLGTDLAIVDKARDYSDTGKIESMRLVGKVKGKDVLIVDDMIATGGTLLNAAKLLRRKGAEKIYVAISLPFFTGNCVKNINNAHKTGLIEMVIGTDAVFHGDKFISKTPWYREVSIAPLFAHVIYNINKKRSVSELLK
ncbi:MAG: ribose-phosphate diphosphokinase [Calditrichia bacterium]